MTNNYAGFSPDYENDRRSAEDFDFDLVDERLSGVAAKTGNISRLERSPRSEFCTQMLINIRDDKRSRVALDAMFVLFGHESLSEVGRRYDMSPEAIRRRLVKFRETAGEKLILQLNQADREFIVRMLRYIRYGSRARLTVDCIFVAMNGEQIGGITMAVIGRQHGLTTQMVSKRVQQVQADLRIPSCRYNKTPEAKLSYAKYNRRPCRAPAEV